MIWGKTEKHIRNYALIAANEQMEENGDVFLSNPAMQVKASTLSWWVLTIVEFSVFAFFPFC